MALCHLCALKLIWPNRHHHTLAGSKHTGVRSNGSDTLKVQAHYFRELRKLHWPHPDGPHCLVLLQQKSKYTPSFCGHLASFLNRLCKLTKWWFHQQWLVQTHLTSPWSSLHRTQASWYPARCFSHHTLNSQHWIQQLIRSSDTTKNDYDNQFTKETNDAQRHHLLHRKSMIFKNVYFKYIIHLPISEITKNEVIGDHFPNFIVCACVCMCVATHTILHRFSKN